MRAVETALLNEEIPNEWSRAARAMDAVRIFPLDSLGSVPSPRKEPTSDASLFCVLALSPATRPDLFHGPRRPRLLHDRRLRRGDRLDARGRGPRVRAHSLLLLLPPHSAVCCSSPRTASPSPPPPPAPCAAPPPARRPPPPPRRRARRATSRSNAHSLAVCDRYDAFGVVLMALEQANATYASFTAEASDTHVLFLHASPVECGGGGGHISACRGSRRDMRGCDRPPPVMFTVGNR